MVLAGTGKVRGGLHEELSESWSSVCILDVAIGKWLHMGGGEGGGRRDPVPLVKEIQLH